jgi:hypothetical protein
MHLNTVMTEWVDSVPEHRKFLRAPTLSIVIDPGVFSPVVAWHAK